MFRNQLKFVLFHISHDFFIKHVFNFQNNRCTKKASVFWSDRDLPSLHHGCTLTTLKESGVHLMTSLREKIQVFRHRYILKQKSCTLMMFHGFAIASIV